MMIGAASLWRGYVNIEAKAQPVSSDEEISIH